MRFGDELVGTFAQGVFARTDGSLITLGSFASSASNERWG